MSEAHALATLAAERALGPLGGDGFDGASGAMAAGIALPVEQGERAVEEFATDESLADSLHEIIRAASELGELADTPISQLYA